MAQRNPKNTRKYRRATIRVLVDYQVQGEIHCDYATTLGAGGMFLKTDLSLKRNDPIKVRFQIPGSETFHELEAMVTWADPRHEDSAGHTHSAGVGLQFTNPEAIQDLAEKLEDYASR